MPTVSSKGQVTIPKKFREKLGIHAGTEVTFDLHDNLIEIKKNPCNGVFDSFMGYLGSKETDKIMDELRGTKE